MVGEREQRRRFAFALQKAMHERKMSGRALAKELAVDPRKITGWLKERGLPNLYESQALAAALKVDEDLFRDPPEVPPPPPEPYYPLERYLLDAVNRGVARGRARRLPAVAASDEPEEQPPQHRVAGGR
jgi:transcriptional regulator with XRE-family HTH domain